jgi:hypothetical protein
MVSIFPFTVKIDTVIGYNNYLHDISDTSQNHN